MDSRIPVDLRRIYVPDSRGFHGSVIRHGEKYICIYHNSENHRLASCFLNLDSELNFKFIEGTHTENLGISKYIDPRIIKYKDAYYVSLSSFTGVSPEKIFLFSLNVDDKITIGQQVSTFNYIKEFKGYNANSREKNWIPWQHDGKFLYTYSLNPHRILEVDMNEAGLATLISEISWKGNIWWENEKWVEPKYRLNCPPVLLPDGTYLSVFHTMRFTGEMVNTKLRRLRGKPAPMQLGTVPSYWTGFFQFEGKFPFRVLKISESPFMQYDFPLPAGWPFHPRPSGGNPFYPFSMMLLDGKIIMVGGSNEIAIAHCSIPLDKILKTLSPVETINQTI